jgi:hypothetical protein
MQDTPLYTPTVPRNDSVRNATLQDDEGGTEVKEGKREKKVFSRVTYVDLEISFTASSCWQLGTEGEQEARWALCREEQAKISYRIRYYRNIG